jgi:hypothetical protein
VGHKDVIEENRSFTEIIGSAFAPYINSLAARGAVFTQSFAYTDERSHHGNRARADLGWGVAFLYFRGIAFSRPPVFSGHVVRKGET